MIWIVLVIWFGVFSAVAEPKSQEIFNRGVWWRIPALIALFALFGPLLYVFH
jgi:hypothetical protein